MLSKKLFLLFPFALASATALSASADSHSITDALKNGDVTLDARYRYEYVDQDGFTDEAKASTLRTRLGYRTDSFQGFSGYLEMENIAEIFEDDYNNGVNGKTQYPTIVDTEDTEVEQAYLTFTGVPKTKIRVGRERFTLDNHRFVGHVGWRQSGQTYDIANIVNESLDDTKLTYAYIAHVNRITGAQWESDTHLFNVSNTSLPVGKITAYAYLIDLEDDSPANSNDTYGISLKGKQEISDGLHFGYYLEYAQQSDAGENTNSYDAMYYHIAPSLKYNGVKLTLGYENLGSDDGTFAFRTPLATGHGFNGWSDRFLTTPNGGLQDYYVDITYKVQDSHGLPEALDGVTLRGQYHIFEADDDATLDEYGEEFNFFARKKFMKHYYTEVKYSNYTADEFSVDTQKLTFNAGVKF